MNPSAATELSLAPLGAGDLIDRAVRLYRRHLFILIRIFAPPVIVAAAGWILTTISFRQLFIVSNEMELAGYFLLLGVGLVVTLGGHLFHLIREEMAVPVQSEGNRCVPDSNLKCPLRHGSSAATSFSNKFDISAPR